VYPVYRAATLHDATLLGDRLKEAGLPFRIRNQALQGALGELPLSVTPEVCVFEQKDVTRARAIVALFEHALRTPIVGELTCAACGETSPANFELCWKCRAELPGSN
jgi:hypothetical protein